MKNLSQAGLVFNRGRWRRGLAQPHGMAPSTSDVATSGCGRCWWRRLGVGRLTAGKDSDD